MSILAKPKKRGRPATGRDPMIGLRASEGLRLAIDAWAAEQADIPGRSEAIRQLVQLGLESGKMQKQAERLVRLLERGDVEGALKLIGIQEGRKSI